MTGKLHGFWMVVVPFFLLPPVVCNITFRRSVCLEVVEEFISEKNPCRIQLKEAKKWLTERSVTSTCGSQPFCRVFFKYSSSEEELYYRFEEVEITIINGSSGVFTEVKQPLGCSDSRGKEKTLSINIYGGCVNDDECAETEKCLRYSSGILKKRIGKCVCAKDNVRINGICRKVDVELGGSCDEDIQCSKAGYKRICGNSSSTCLCVNGYAEVNGHCIRTGLEVNETCWFDEQCNGTVNSSVCRKNACVCMAEHYYADGVCQPPIKELPGADFGTAESQENKDSSISQIVTAVIGGFVLGILSCLTAVYVLKLRNRRWKQNRNTEAKFVNNISYEKEISTKVQKDSRNLDQTKISHVRPIIKGNPEHSNVSEPKPESNDIYNHLNEKMEEDADMDVYDRALPVTAGMFPDEEYTNLSRCAVQSVRLQTAIGAQDDYAVAKIPEDADDYSYLERQ